MHRHVKLGLSLMVAGVVAGCAGSRQKALNEGPTLASLAGRQIAVAADPGIPASEEKAIAAYNDFLKAAPRATQRSQALRRLGDLEMDSAENRSASGNSDPDYRAAIARYRDVLAAYPKDPANDRVLYQLARAHELGGDLDTALVTLDRLVREYPETQHRDEAQFRRGELLFTARQYPRAEQAYAIVLQGGQQSPFRERALYMQGWSLFKQGRLEESLHSFFGVLDAKLTGDSAAGAEAEELDGLAGLSRADRELVEDTFRVTSLALQNLQGAESIAAYMNSDVRHGYEFRVYQQLGELYIKQDRVKDAADTFGAFARRYPRHVQAPLLQARVIDIYERSGFATLALDAKKDYVVRYGLDGEFRRANPAGWGRAQPLVKTHLSALARHYHASAQKTRASADYQEAVHWYRAYLESFPNDPDAAQSNFLLAELLFEDRRFGEAALEYERAAYDYPVHTQSADAGYAALLAHANQEKSSSPDDKAARQRASVNSALRFAAAFGNDPRTGTVLTDAAEKLFSLGEGDRASSVAQQVLALDPPAAPAQRRVAWTVVAHTAFERGDFARSETGYREAVALMPEKDPGRADLVERLAASVYKQGEQARAAGQPREAVGHFARVAVVAPQSSVRASAQYDAAATLIGLKDWDGAARTLEEFREAFPRHPLQAEVPAKLAVVYLENGRWSQAAVEFERMASLRAAPDEARAALWQAGDLYEKAADAGAARLPAVRVYERYVAQYPAPLEPALEARMRLARLAKADGRRSRELALMNEILQADRNGGTARTDRTRFLGASAALVLAEPSVEAYRKVALVEPLKKQLQLKKSRMEEALKAYAVAAEYGVADVTTAATYHTAAIYQDFGRAMLESQRPRRLSKVELEQYNVLLEEQAFPFEEKAIELHEGNARRVTSGLYDRWIQDSFAALAKLRPVRYGKLERSEAVIDAIR